MGRKGTGAPHRDTGHLCVAFRRIDTPSRLCVFMRFVSTHRRISVCLCVETAMRRNRREAGIFH